MKIKVAELNGKQYLLGNWAVEKASVGMRYWVHPDGNELAAGYTQCENQLMYSVHYPDGEVLEAGCHRSSRKSMMREINSILSQVCTVTRPEAFDAWVRLTIINPLG